MVDAVTDAPRHIVSSEELVARAHALRPLLAEHAGACDRERRIQQPVFEAMRDAGLFKICLPKRAGGFGLPFLTQIEVAAELGYACASSAWGHMVLCATTSGIGFVPKALTEQILRTGNETLCGVVMRNGKAKPVEGGYLVSGKWPFASGCLHADWGMVGVEILGPDGTMAAPGWAFMKLAGDHAPDIEMTWNVTGMRGTGSNTIVADETFVPASLVVPLAGMRAEVSPDEMEPGDRWPLGAYFGLGLTGPLLGATQRIMDIVKEKAKSRPVTYWKYNPQTESHAVLKEIGQAQMEIDSAWLHVRKASAVLDEIAQERDVTLVERVQIPANCGYAMGLLRNAAERLIDIYGSSSFQEGGEIDRIWRDINFGSRHAAFTTNSVIECYGRVLTGQELNMSELPPKAR